MARQFRQFSKGPMLFVLAWLLVAGWAFAQSAPAVTRLVGQVVEAVGGAPIAGADVTLAPAGKTARTDAQGRFAFTGLAAGTQTVRASAKGFQPAAQKVTIPATGTVTVKLALARAANAQAAQAKGGDRAAKPAPRKVKMAEASMGYGVGMGGGGAMGRAATGRSYGYAAPSAPPVPRGRSPPLQPMATAQHGWRRSRPARW